MLDLLLNGSYLGIIVLLVLTGAGLPVPEEVPIIAAGVAASSGHLNPWGAFACCLIGALMGDTIIYAIGYRWGHGLLKDHPRFAQLLHAEREQGLERMVRRHGLKVFLLTRFLVGIRGPVYLAAGIIRVPLYQFLAVDALCASIVVGLFFGLSFRYGHQIQKWIQNTELAFTLVVLAVIVVVGFLLWRRGGSLASHVLDWLAGDKGSKDSAEAGLANEPQSNDASTATGDVTSLDAISTDADQANARPLGAAGSTTSGMSPGKNNEPARNGTSSDKRNQAGQNLESADHSA